MSPRCVGVGCVGSRKGRSSQFEVDMTPACPLVTLVTLIRFLCLSLARSSSLVPLPVVCVSLSLWVCLCGCQTCVSAYLPTFARSLPLLQVRALSHFLTLFPSLSCARSPSLVAPSSPPSPVLALPLPLLSCLGVQVLIGMHM